MLEEKVSIPGRNVAIIGGGMVGIETAEYLMANARGPMMTTIIEMTDRIGAGMVPNNLVPTMQRLRQDGVQLLVNTKVRSVRRTASRSKAMELSARFPAIRISCMRPV